MSNLRPLIWTLLLLCGCSSTSRISDPAEFTSNTCRGVFYKAKKLSTEKQLDSVSDLFHLRCYREVIGLANFLRQESRDKLYSVSTEFAEVFTPEGTFAPYVLESYERSFLTLLTAISYLNLEQKSAALIELRRSINEENAVLYNYGANPVISLLQAALWERFDPAMARPFWQQAVEFKNQDPQVSKFARARLAEIDRGGAAPAAWRIYGLGQLPGLDWNSTLLTPKKGIYKITSTAPFPKSCSSKDSLLVSTQSWSTKIAGRYDSEYHPFLFTKSLIRLPFGLAYGVAGVSAGLAVGVGGCLVDQSAKSSDGSLCQVSMKAGGYLMAKSANLVEYTLKPDLRRWKKLPSAFLISRLPAGEVPSGCADSLSELNRVAYLGHPKGDDL